MTTYQCPACPEVRFDGEARLVARLGHDHARSDEHKARCATPDGRRNIHAFWTVRDETRRLAAANAAGMLF